jgi:hypothetical protein
VLSAAVEGEVRAFPEGDEYVFTLHKVANDGAREEWIFTRLRQGGTLDAYRDPAGSSGDLRNTLRLGRADCFYKLHRALDGAGVCISVVFAIQ